MRDRLRAAVIALALLAASAAVLTAGIAQIEAGSGCGVGLAAPCQTGGTP